MTTVLLSLGANLGNRAENIRRAIALLEKQNALFIPIFSSFYETEPLGYTEQPEFLNVAVTAQTPLSAQELYSACKEAERALGRQDRGRWREREIDIDIVLFGEEHIENELLSIPHPRMHERRFVLEPATEIAPIMLHPVFKKSLLEVLALCPDTTTVRKISNV